MLNWYKKNRIGATGVMACLLFGGIEVLVLLIEGSKRNDLNTPVGLLAQVVASQFTDPPSPIRVGTDREELIHQLIVAWQALLTLLFAALFWLRTRIKRPSRLADMLLALQTALGVLSMSSLLYVLAAELALVLPLRKGIKWLAAQVLLLTGVFASMAVLRRLEMGDDLVRLIFVYGGFGMVFQVLAFGVATVAVRERVARTGLAAANARLLATQAMLADTVRSGERTRIARDLHDAVGHHLTALNLHLDLALRQASGNAPESLRTSRELARSLLAEVRLVVSSERSEQRIDLRAAVATMCSGIPVPAIRFDFDAALEIDSPVLAHTLFFCVQEALTNAVRHSGAGRLDIDIRRRDAEVILAVRDDGYGRPGAAEGNGLRGMRERVEGQGGSMAAGAGAGGGYAIQVALPLAGSAA